MEAIIGTVGICLMFVGACIVVDELSGMAGRRRARQGNPQRPALTPDSGVLDDLLDAALDGYHAAAGSGSKLGWSILQHRECDR